MSRPHPDDAPTGLPALEARLRQDLSWLALPSPPWVPDLRHGGRTVAPVAIIGGGMAGLAAQAALKLIGIPAEAYDQAPAGLEGPWATTARMETLRSPKQLVGPALGLPALTFRAWFEAQFGAAAWEALNKIPRLQWMDYLRWYRRVLELRIHNEHRVSAIQPRADGLVALRVRNADGEHERLARHVVLATGRDGLGGPAVPDAIRALPRPLWAHAGEAYDPARLRGLRVGVVGGAASAMDAAATALEAGAAGVDMLIRRADFIRINKGKGAGNPGMTHGFWQLPDAWRWRIRHYLNTQPPPPPQGSTLRVSRHGNARFHFGSPLLDVRAEGEAIHVRTPKRDYTFDFLLAATGYLIDWRQRPEFAAFAPHVRAWRDRYEAPADEADAELDDSPDLGPAFEFQPRQPGACPGLERIHCFCYPAALSHGQVSGDIPAVSDGARRLAQELASRLFQEDIEHHYDAMRQYDEPELEGHEWTPAP